jgi:hypothetical protein
MSLTCFSSARRVGTLGSYPFEQNIFSSLVKIISHIKSFPAFLLNLLYAFAKLNRPHCPHLERARVVYFVRCVSVLPAPTAQSSS